MGRKIIAVFGLLALLTSGACATYNHGRYYVHAGPPSARYDRPYNSPGRGYVWQQGYYRWNGRGYYWVPGRYERVPRGYSRWEAPRWQHDRGGWFFVEGRWR